MRGRANQANEARAREHYWPLMARFGIQVISSLYSTVFALLFPSFSDGCSNDNVSVQRVYTLKPKRKCHFSRTLSWYRRSSVYAREGKRKSQNHEKAIETKLDEWTTSLCNGKHYDWDALICYFEVNLKQSRRKQWNHFHPKSNIYFIHGTFIIWYKTKIR